MKFCYLFSELSAQDINIAGGKGANLGEMTRAGIPVPPGFVVSSEAYSYFLESTGLNTTIKQLLSTVEYDSPDKLIDVSNAIKNKIIQTPVPQDLAEKITYFYEHTFGNKTTSVAVRSSATAEDLPQASFAGQQETFLNISGTLPVIEAIRKCWASLFEARAIFYRHQQHFDHEKVKIAVPVQQMIIAESAGIMFTMDPSNHDPARLIIEAGFGLGQPLVSGEITPATYIVHTADFKILEKHETIQPWLLSNHGQVELTTNEGSKAKLPDHAIIELAKLGMKLAAHYHHPQDIEWVYCHKKLYIVQTRPITTHAQDISYKLLPGQELETLLIGGAASPGIATGTVRIIKQLADLETLKQGDILVSTYTSPDFVTAMKRVVGIITDQGGITSHAAIVSRELGIPCVVGTDTATSLLQEGMAVTIDGYTGRIYKGSVQFEKIIKTASRIRTKTKIYLNLANPEVAAEAAMLPVDGVGLLRNEFIISQIGKHPQEFIKEDNAAAFVDQLAAAVTEIAQPFYPRPVIYRANDFKTNEYAHLEGGSAFEPTEENPLIGYRGATRYIHDADTFKLELEAIKKVRQSFNNLWLMIPFIRSIDELKDIKAMITQAGLIQNDTFKLWIMVETPWNVLRLPELLKLGIDGVSIGSNDLTMLTIGVDRDNQRIAHLYNEADPAVMHLIQQTIKTCREMNVTSSLCGQLASNNIDAIKQFVRDGITSISINRDALNTVKNAVAQAESER
jgi:pyruvate,water dikinase